MEKRNVQVIPKRVHPTAALRVCGYARVSTDEEEQLESFVTQVEYYTHLIQKNPEWIYTGVYADEGISGTSTCRRDEFNRMIRDCKRGRIDLIITKSISRFARNTFECIQVIRELKAMGIGIYFEKERINTLSAESELALTIYISVAQEESISISQNAKWAIQRRMRDGSWLISSVAYGYRKDELGELIPEPNEARIVKRIYDEYLSGVGYFAIAMILNKEGIPSPRGGKWADDTIRGILMNDIYAGDLRCQKFFNEDLFPHKRRRNRGEYPQYLIPDDHEAIISRERASLVRETMEFRKQCLGIGVRTGMYQERYSFSGRIVCGECGAHFKRQKIKVNETNRYIKWSCKNHLMNKESCKMTGIREETLQNAFIRLSRKLHDNVRTLLVPLVNDISSLHLDEEKKEEINSYNNQILKIEKQIQLFRGHVSEGTMDAAIFIQKSQQLKGEIAYLKELRNRELENGSYDIILEELKVLIQYVGGDIKNGTFDGNLFDKIVKQVTVTNDRKVNFYLISGLCLTEDL